MIPLPICDFCSAPGPVWCYPAASFKEQEFGGINVDDWLAYEECHTLIEGGDPWDLARRALLAPAVRAAGVDPVFATEWALKFHAQFFAHRRGPARRIAA